MNQEFLASANLLALKEDEKAHSDHEHDCVKRALEQILKMIREGRILAPSEIMLAFFSFKDGYCMGWHNAEAWYAHR